MLKRFLTLSLLLAATTNIQAETIYYGIALINQDITQEVKTISPASTATVTTDASGFGIYADLFTDDKMRYNATLSHVGHTNFSITSLTASADYLIPINSQFTFFAGGTLGGAAMVFDDASFSDAGLGAIYGVQAGAIAFLPANIMLEFGYRIRPTSIETDILNTSGAVIQTNTVDELSETYLSLIITF